MLYRKYGVSVREARFFTLVHALYEDGPGRVDCYISFTYDCCNLGEDVQCDCLYPGLMLSMFEELLGINFYHMLSS